MRPIMTKMPASQTGGNARQDRLAAALRENLKRRKAQGRLRAATTHGQPDQPPQETNALDADSIDTSHGALPQSAPVEDASPADKKT
jgi:hypothetical protein